MVRDSAGQRPQDGQQVLLAGRAESGSLEHPVSVYHGPVRLVGEPVPPGNAALTVIPIGEGQPVSSDEGEAKSSSVKGGAGRGAARAGYAATRATSTATAQPRKSTDRVGSTTYVRARRKDGKVEQVCKPGSVRTAPAPGAEAGPGEERRGAAISLRPQSPEA